MFGEVYATIEKYSQFTFALFGAKLLTRDFESIIITLIYRDVLWATIKRGEWRERWHTIKLKSCANR